MNEVLGFIVYSTLFLLAGAAVIPRFRASERSWLWVALLIHIAAAFTMVAVTRYVFGGGDMLGYHWAGSQLAQSLRADFGSVAPRLIQLLFQQRVAMPIEIPAMGSSTASMDAIATILIFLFGSSLYGICVIVTAAGFFSRLLVYRVLRQRLPGEYHRAALLSCLYVPSVVFWTAGLLKEPMAMIGLCVAIWAGHELATRGMRLVPLLALPPALILSALTKAYVLIPLGLAAAAWYYVHRSSGGTGRMRRLRPVQLVIAGAFALGFVFGIGELFPRYQIDQFAEQAAQLQSVGQRVTGGSSYSLGAPDVDTGPTGIYAIGPIALLTALFRPQLFDVSSAVAAMSAIEMTVLLWLLLRGIRRRGLRGCGRVISRSHTLLFCLIFVIVFGTGVGMTTTNFGTLARYRAPMMPMYVLLLLVFSGVGRLVVARPAAGIAAAAVGSRDRESVVPNRQLDT